MIGVLTKQPLVARADIGIGIRFIAEVLAPKQAAVALIVDCALDRNVRHHACRFTVSDLLSVGVTGIRHYLETLYPKCSLCSLSHWFEATAKKTCLRLARQSSHLCLFKKALLNNHEIPSNGVGVAVLGR
jgi:hypothetical protein